MIRIKNLIFIVLPLLIIGCNTDVAPEVLLEFQPQESKTKSSFRGLSVVNDSVCWISGSNGSVLRTVDGGNSWEKHRVPGHKNSDFRDIQAFSEKQAIIMSIGSPAKIFRTNNGGKTWWLTYFYEHPDVFLDGMAFWNEKEGIAFGDQIDGRIFIIKTVDGGNSWHPIEEEKMPPALEGEGGFAGSGSGIYAGFDSLAWIGLGFPRGRVLRSWDKGESWNFYLTGMGNGDSSRGIYSIDFDQDLNGIVVGGSWNKPVSNFLTAATSKDGGSSWTMVEENHPDGYRSCVAFIPNTKYVVSTGTTGSDISYDKGISWNKLDSIGYNTIGWSPSGQIGWIAGNNGKIARMIVSKPVVQE